MPDAGTPARAKQTSAISTLHHELLTDDALADWLDELDDAELDPEQEAVVREVRRDHERATRVPADLVERISEASSNALPVWKEAKAEDDFDAFADTLEELVELRREYAAAIDPDRDPYEVLFEEYEPYLGIDTAEDVLTDLRDALVPLIDDIGDSDVTLADPFEGRTTTTRSTTSSRRRSTCWATTGPRPPRHCPHPFSMGTQFDARVTTRFTPEDPLDALFSTIHEFGHATYNLGLPHEHYATPLGEDRNLSVHESQSRLWENHVGRSEAFWNVLTETFKDHLGTEDTAQQATKRRIRCTTTTSSGSKRTN